MGTTFCVLVMRRVVSYLDSIQSLRSININILSCRFYSLVVVVVSVNA